jgi:antitoxin component of MazEF toxin-antitoxin module
VSIRKIQKIGNSAGILLPKGWLESQGLKAGSKVRIEVSERRVSVMPEISDKDIKVDNRFMRELARSLKRNQNALKRLS